jgi:hypothetical protein
VFPPSSSDIASSCIWPLFVFNWPLEAFDHSISGKQTARHSHCQNDDELARAWDSAGARGGIGWRRWWGLGSMSENSTLKVTGPPNFASAPIISTWTARPSLLSCPLPRKDLNGGIDLEVLLRWDCAKLTRGRDNQVTARTDYSMSRKYTL